MRRRLLISSLIALVAPFGLSSGALLSSAGAQDAGPAGATPAEPAAPPPRAEPAPASETARCAWRGARANRHPRRCSRRHRCVGADRAAGWAAAAGPERCHDQARASGTAAARGEEVVARPRDDVPPAWLLPPARQPARRTGTSGTPASSTDLPGPDGTRENGTGLPRTNYDPFTFFSPADSNAYYQRVAS